MGHPPLHETSIFPAPKDSEVCADMTGSTGEAENLRMANLNKTCWLF